MSRRQRHQRTYLSVARADGRLEQQLMRHLAARSAREDWGIVSRRTVTAGVELEPLLLNAIVHANIVVILATAAYFDDSLARAEMDLALERFAAGEVHLVVVHAASCLLDERLDDAVVIAQPSFSGRGREGFWRTAAARIAALCETSPPGRPRYEDEENRDLGELLRAAWWTTASRGDQDFSSITEHQALLRADGRLKPGDILGQRFHVRRRIGTPAQDCWEAYDFLGRQPVQIHWITAVVPHPWPRGVGVRQWAELEHSGVVRVLTTVLEEPGLRGNYFVLERFVGAPLRDAVLSGQMAGLTNIEVLASIADALVAIHKQGLTHGAVTIDTIRVGDVEKELRCKLEHGWMECGLNGADPGSGASSADDIMAFGRVVLACLHGGLLPDDATPVQLRRILQLSEAEPELKALLARSFAANSACSMDLNRVAELLRGAPLQRAAASTGWFDLEMRSVGGATSWIGAATDDQRARPIERPARRVVVDGFELCIYPVTQRLYKLITGTNPSAHVDECAPVHNIGFREALNFCNRLSMLRGLQPAYDLTGSDAAWRYWADGYRLPTESEWEIAARGNRETLFPWGQDEPGEQACWNGRGSSLGLHNRKAPSAVWDHPQSATATGFFDMAGNVWEWCWDWFAPFDEWAVNDDDPLMEPIGPTECRIPDVRVAVPGGAYRVLRGGAWNVEDAAVLRSTTRSTEVETARDPDIGFRLARGAKPLASSIKLRKKVPLAMTTISKAVWG